MKTDNLNDRVDADCGFCTFAALFPSEIVFVETLVG
jgi:hypothetical protein